MTSAAGALSPALLITLADVALLTRVQRPVVSMWRARSKNSGTPFPRPIKPAGEQELFDAGQIVEWLAATGRGNNPHAADDVAAFATPSGPEARRRHFDALTALLTLRCLTDAPLGSRAEDDLLDDAEAHDPEDAFLFTEVEDLGTELQSLASYADLLTDAAYSAEAAFEQLLADRFRAGAHAQARTALTDAAVDLVAATAIELAAGSAGPPVFADDGGGDFLRAVADILGESESATLSAGGHDDGAARLARRRLLVHGLSKENLRIIYTLPDSDTVQHSGTVRDSGAARERASGTDDGRTIRLAQFPSPAFPELAPRDLLTAIDEMALGLSGSDCGVVLAPASVLTDSLTGAKGDRAAGDHAAADVRSDVLRSGRVRAIVRLPQGLLKSKPRQAQALWVLGPAHRNVPIADRWTMVADLTGHTLTDDIRQDLVGDLAASMGGREFIRAHSFRFARLVLTRSLLAGSGAL
ncbi:MAG: hypothetical protein M3021_05820, partial [Actinomycetota bacterium]|nr:hypothetical protein [Actinomycetota bacterium]